MILSMTAFSRSEGTKNGMAMTWEVRSVNHRYLDMSIRLPDEFRALEPAVRALLSNRLSRGKIDCSLRIQTSDDAHPAIEINQQAVDHLVEAMRSVSSKLWDAAPVSTLDLLKWPGIVSVPTISLDEIRPAALELLGDALAQLIEARQREGQDLAKVMLARVDSLLALVASAQARMPEIIQATQMRLRARLDQLLAEVNQERLEQELAYLVQKLDVEEEMDRLNTHLAEVKRILSQGGKVGRRLDFLMQELNREANTAGSKSNDAALTQVAVEMKVLIEQMREQVQNIE